MQYKLLKLNYQGSGSYFLRVEEVPSWWNRIVNSAQKRSFEIIGDGNKYWRNAHCNLNEKLNPELIAFAANACKNNKKGMG